MTINKLPMENVKETIPTYSRWLRSVVLCASFAVMLLITAWPHAFGSTTKTMSHSAAMISMLGMSCGFVYGLGFIPRSSWLRWLFSAPVALGLMAFGFVLKVFLK